MNANLVEALAPHSARIPRMVREHEVLRVAGWMPGDNQDETARKAAGEVLRWAQRRAGGSLPPEAWRGETFEFLSGGRNRNALRLRIGTSDIWAIRADDPDKNVPERVWTTEVVLGHVQGEPVKFSARLLVSTPEPELQIEPAVPGFVLQVAAKCDLMAGSQAVSTLPVEYRAGDDTEALIQHLNDPDRVLPTIVLTLGEGAALPSIDDLALARSLSGLAHVTVVHPDACWGLTTSLGKRLSVFGGAARIYMPGFNESADPFAHQLVLASQLSSIEDVARTTRWLRETAARGSLHRTRLGSDVLTFAAIRTATLDLRQTTLREADASDTDQLAAALDQIKAMQGQIEALKVENDYYVDQYEKEREEAKAAETQQLQSAWRIQEMSDRIEAAGGNSDSDAPLPTTWTEFTDWCGKELAGKLVLASAARRGVRKPFFDDVQTAARSLHWLATKGRAFFRAGGGSISNISILDGIQNAPCGSDSYDFAWKERKLSANWHIKNGGNSRDPSRCLRIYYCFDEQTQQVIVSDMPAHRSTGAS